MPQELAVAYAGYAVVVWLMTAVLHIAIASLIHGNAHEIDTERQPPHIAPWIWTLAALLGGIVVLGIYWLMYHSTLKK